MGRQRMPDMPDEAPEIPEAVMTQQGHKVQYAPQGGLPAAQQGAPTIPGAVHATPPDPKDVKPPRRFRVDNLQPGGRNYIDQNGKQARLVPGKILDERYFDVKFIKRQGFTLVEVDENEPQIGRMW